MLRNTYAEQCSRIGLHAWTTVDVRTWHQFLADRTIRVRYWKDTVLCLSVCLSVAMCIVVLGVGAGVESCTVVLLRGTSYSLHQRLAVIGCII